MPINFQAGERKNTNARKFFILVLVMLVLAPLVQAEAQSGIDLSTTYPGIHATAGETVTFPLQLRNQRTNNQIIGLRLSSIPEEWKASFKGRGREIGQVYVKGEATEYADLELKVPAEVNPGDYPLTVVAVDEGGNKSNLRLTVTITEASAGTDQLEAQYSELKGPSDAVFKFKLNLTNNSINEQAYSLGAQVPEGWQITFKPSFEQQQVASIIVKPEATQGLDVEVKPAVRTEAGEYIIPVQVVSAGGMAQEELKVIISGTYDLVFTTTTGRLNADVVAGKERKINLEVRNNGSGVLNNISFSSREPQNWSVTFEPKTVDTLEPGASRQVTATISADGKAISGDYVTSLSASTQETRSQVDLRVTVKTSTLWGLVGILLVLAVIGGVYRIFHTYGRR